MNRNGSKKEYLHKIVQDFASVLEINLEDVGERLFI